MRNQIEYRFIKNEIAQFALFDKNITNDLQEVQFQTETEFGYDKENRVLCCRITVTMMRQDDVLLKTELDSYFKLTEDSIVQLQSENRIVFDPVLLIQFASLCYGTLRGVLHVKTLGTVLNAFVLPPIYFQNIINKPFVVEN